ncbi:uncharacterized protein N7483_006500 [Penicillium malachiteum]|uniref:uncharacterized protein n=1 Tax=Penicillium malachiteum TaxID=1324776 RepID=UPI002548F2B5|nr:uncharacterized protein N7483_006500 [Penicillium malachiteum]KAJ5725143.1 hypothetical protein N7483_006500 [Penicillium malachiteum]
MDSPTRPILSPTKALNPVSPERMNQQTTIPASPSLPSDLLSLHHKSTRGVSEVQAKVAFLNSLARGASPGQGQSVTNNAALQRAILGREEAESVLTSVQEELSEAQTRERRISERLESLLEELHGAKERQAHERSIFEKEIRKARKEAFRAGSTLVKLQEELKHAKSETKALKDEVSAEREAKNKAKQEAFERAYALAGLTEELEVLKGQLRSMETTNHSNTLDARAHEIRKEDFGRLSLVEGDLAFLTTPRRPKRAAADSIRSPAQERDGESFVEATLPKRPRLSGATSPVEDLSTTTDSVPAMDTRSFDDLQDELHFERRRRAEAEEMVHFMNIECQFERCSCRIAEHEGRRYIYDADYFEKFQKPQVEAEEHAKAKALAEKQAKAAAELQAQEESAARIARLEAEATRRATEMKAQAQEEATRIFRLEAEAKAQVTRLKAEAEAEVARMQAEAKASVARIQADAEERAAQIQAEAEERASQMQEEAAQQEYNSHSASYSSHTPSVEPPVSLSYENSVQSAEDVKPEPTEPPEKMPMPEEPLVTFSPETGTFKTFPSPLRDNPRPPPPPRRTDTRVSPTPLNNPLQSRQSRTESRTESAASNRHVESSTPTDEPRASRMAHRKAPEADMIEKTQPHESTDSRSSRPRVRTEYSSHSMSSMTKRVPLREAMDSRTAASFFPDQPINREEALAQIRARRGRARSNVRSVSAAEISGRAAGPAGSTATTPGQGPRRIPNVQTHSSKPENDLVERRDMSAPVRMFRR